MEMYIWSTVIVLSKLTFYAGCTSVASYTFLGNFLEKAHQSNKISTTLPPYLKLIFSSILMAFIANVLWFFANTGAIAEEGIQGALDATMIELMWDSSIGEITLFRIVGLAIAILVLILSVYIKLEKLNRLLTRGFFLLSLLLLTYSFSISGHVSELGIQDKLTLILHVLLMTWWLGALIPLRLACDILTDDDLYTLMEKFSKQASIVVSLLLLAGIGLAIQLIGNTQALLNSGYGQVLLLKLFLVALILSLAAKNKFKLVPALRNTGSRNLLAKSISMEISVALTILLATALLTSVVGPEVY